MSDESKRVFIAVLNQLRSCAGDYDPPEIEPGYPPPGDVGVEYATELRGLALKFEIELIDLGIT